MAIKTILKTRRLRKRLLKYHSKEIVETLLSDKIDLESPCEKLKEGDVEYIFAIVTGESPDEISQLMGKVSDHAIEYGGMTMGLVSSLVIIAWGVLKCDLEEWQNRVNLVKYLKNEVGTKVKIIHGSTKGHYGDLGGPQYTNFSFIIPEFLQILSALRNTEFGEIIEFKS